MRNEIINRKWTVADVSGFDMNQYKFINRGIAVCKVQSFAPISRFVNHARAVDEKYNSAFGVDDWTYVDTFLNRCIVDNGPLIVNISESPDEVKFIKRKVGIKIIIPCYKVGGKITRCIESILNQGFKNFHIVCVEDCSPDNTWEKLVDCKLRNYDKITLVKNQNNSGPGMTRNNGYYST